MEQFYNKKNIIVVHFLKFEAKENILNANLKERLITPVGANGTSLEE